MKSARSQTLRMIVNVVAFQLGWFACVLAAARGRDMAGVSAASVIVAAHVAMPARRGGEFRLIAAAVVIGAFVILLDPIFQGLAIALIGGSIASTVLTLVIVPLIYHMTEEKKHRSGTAEDAVPEKTMPMP